mmetsp:Transcript_25553/g.61439  ORF Transcript_25553/g.61439 Transcript_25553/m.61439 type:complete len:596 (-) Transcript_25553:49-1836(-)
MKLLRSTFVAFCLAFDHASGFAPQINSNSILATQQRLPISNVAKSTTSLNVGIHEVPDSQITEDERKKENMFQQILQETDDVRDYLGWLVDESGAADAIAEGGDEETSLGEVKADAGEVELFGGGGDAPTEATKEANEYKPVLRTDLGGTVLLSGTVDPTLLNILNNNFFGQDNVPNFEFGTIKALVEDVPSAKKGAISREARYGGLLDKLVIEPVTGADGALPTKDEMAGATSWIVRLSSEEATAALPKVAELAKGAEGLNNLVVMVDGHDATKSAVERWDAVEEASADGEAFRCTLLTVGELYDGGGDGDFYHIGPSGGGSADAAAPGMSKKKAYRLLAHALALDCTANTALTAYEYSPEALEAVVAPYAEGEFAEIDDDGKELADKMADVKMEGRMIQAMRELGFAQLLELDVLVGKGVKSYKDYLANPPRPKKEITPAMSAQTKRDEEDERIMAILEASSVTNEAEEKAKAEKLRNIEIEGIAKEWLIKEYTLRMLAGTIDDSLSEKDFMVSAHDEALVEAEKTYVRVNSKEHAAEQKRSEAAKKGNENKLFYDGMPDLLRKKREKMVERIKEQYMDLLSQDELEEIILSE